MPNKSSRCQFLFQSSLNQLGWMNFYAWVRKLSSRSSCTTASFQSPAGPTFDHFPWQVLWSIWATTERLGAKSRSWSQSRCQSNQIKSQRAEPIESWIRNKAIFLLGIRHSAPRLAWRQFYETLVNLKSSSVQNTKLKLRSCLPS